MMKITFKVDYNWVVWLVKQSFAPYNQSMHRDTATLNFSFNWKEYWSLPLVGLLHLAIITYHANYNSFNVSTAPNLNQAVRMQVSLQKRVKPTPVIKKVQKPIVKKKPKKKVAKQKPLPKVQKQVAATQSSHKLEALELAKKNFKSLLKNYSRPEYPRREFRRGVTGAVILKFLVKGNGEVVKISVAESSGNGALDSSAFNAAKEWKFKDLGISPGQVVSLVRRVVFNIN
jgi:TonB family protein